MKKKFTILFLLCSICCVFAQQASIEPDFDFYKKKKKKKRDYSETVQLGYQMILDDFGIEYTTHFLFLTYDRRFRANQTHGLGFKVGIGNWFNNKIIIHITTNTKQGAIDNKFGFDKVRSLPIGLNYIFGEKKKHHFEVGLDAMVLLLQGTESRFINNNIISKRESRLFVLPYPSLGYRYQSKEQRFVGHILLKYAFFPLEIGGGYRF